MHLRTCVGPCGCVMVIGGRPRTPPSCIRSRERGLPSFSCRQRHSERVLLHRKVRQENEGTHESCEDLVLGDNTKTVDERRVVWKDFPKYDDHCEAQRGAGSGSDLTLSKLGDEPREDHTPIHVDHLPPVTPTGIVTEQEVEGGDIRIVSMLETVGKGGFRI